MRLWMVAVLAVMVGTAAAGVASYSRALRVQPAGPDPLAGFAPFVETTLKKYGVPGAVVAVIKDDKVVFLEGFGVRDIEKPADKMDGDTVFLIASATKSFTAALVGTFVDEHQLRWDTPVCERLPGFLLKDNYATRNATARDLLAHRTGLPAFSGDLLEAFGYPRQEILERLQYVEPACTFREQANYSNLGYFSAGMLAAHLGKSTWDDLLKKRIFDPLKMTRTSSRSQDRLAHENLSQPHWPVPGGQARRVPPETHDGLGPAGSINSTAKDLTRFVRMLLNEGELEGQRVLEKETVRELFKPAMVTPPTIAETAPISETMGMSFTMGFGTFSFRDTQVLEKGGAKVGTRSVLILVPEKKLGVVVLANLNLSCFPEAVRAEVLERYLGRSGEDLQKSIWEKNQAITDLFAKLANEKLEKKGPPTQPLLNYTGHYLSRLYGPIKVELVDGELRWWGGNTKFGGKVEPVSLDTFRFCFPDGTNFLPEVGTFTIGPDGKAQSLHTELFGNLPRAIHQ